MFLPQLSPIKVKKRLKIAFVGSCLPRKCGIATFSASLSKELEVQIGRGATSFVTMNNNQQYDYSVNVVSQIEQDTREDYSKAADILNNSAVDVVSLQHEFGLFGGPDGNYIIDFLTQLHKPVVTTLHTVLENPTPGQKKTFIEVAVFSQALVVMNEMAITIMTEKYDIPKSKIHLIQHGVPDSFYIDPSFYKYQLQLNERFIILTFGFLSPNKGIEVMLKALPSVVRKHPEVLYIVLGITHPGVKKQHGEEYRESLMSLSKQEGIDSNVLFVDKFMDDISLNRYLGAADLVVCPYHSEGQITSGVLSNALGMGKAIISTPYLHAREALAGGRGVLVNFKDSIGMADATMNLIENPTERLALAGRAYVLGRQMGWGRVTGQYLEVFEYLAELAITDEGSHGLVHTLPDINMNYLKVLTDDAGIIQHTLYGIPDYSYNYSADDAGRAMVACGYYFNLFRDESVLLLVDRYLAFLAHARQVNGWFHNYMNYQRDFPEQKISQDTFGRCLWGLGAVARLVKNRHQGLLAAELFETSLPMLGKLSYPRAQAYSACGLAAYLMHHPESVTAKDGLRLIAESLLALYHKNATAAWLWFEDRLTYDNARLPQALLLAYRHLGEPAYLKAALEALDFLIGVQYHDGYFDMIGNEGWYEKGEDKALFCQQPVDAGALTETCLLAMSQSGRREYLEMAYASFQWYLGRNRLGESLYHPAMGACSDGLGPNGPSKNKGAESTISFLLAQVALYRWELLGRFNQGDNANTE